VELEPERLEKKEVNVPKNKKIYAYITHERLRKDNPFLNACGSRAHIKVPKINPKAHFWGARAYVRKNRAQKNERTSN
jgi:hypothetical protein